MALRGNLSFWVTSQGLLFAVSTRGQARVMVSCVYVKRKFLLGGRWSKETTRNWLEVKVSGVGRSCGWTFSLDSPIFPLLCLARRKPLCLIAGIEVVFVWLRSTTKTRNIDLEWIKGKKHRRSVVASTSWHILIVFLWAGMWWYSVAISPSGWSHEQRRRRRKRRKKMCSYYKMGVR